jgi:para-aminobenzoate synthetase component I
MMRSTISEVENTLPPEALAARVRGDGTERGVMLLRSRSFDSPHARYSFLVARPFLRFRSWGSRCEQRTDDGTHVQFGNPWHVLDALMSRCELLDDVDLPFPLGGCFGYWGYDLKNFVEPKLPRKAVNDLELPDCQVGFYSSLVVFDHALGKTWIVSTGLGSDGSRDELRARIETEKWRAAISTAQPLAETFTSSNAPADVVSTSTRESFISSVRTAQEYIRLGHIYQVNLSHRLSAPFSRDGWVLFQRLSEISPAPFAAYMDCGDFELACSSPELFLRLSGRHVVTRPIKGTRPRSADPTRDAQLTYELQTSTKEMAELVMITDLLRNDLGRVCEFGTVQVPELVRLERYAQVQHLVSTVEGRLRSGITHFKAFSSCFPGGSVTGAPKIRAMEIIDELEPVTRGPYTGALGYLGFNRESQLNIVIRTAIYKTGRAHFNLGAGIVADSNPEAEFEETMAKGRGFIEAVRVPSHVAAPQA